MGQRISEEMGELFALTSGPRKRHQVAPQKRHDSPTFSKTVGAVHHVVEVLRSDNGSETVFGMRLASSGPHI